MKILICSDSHGRRDLLAALTKMHPDADKLWFLGDGLRDLCAVSEQNSALSVTAVRGNNDWADFDTPYTSLCAAQAVRALLCHGHTFHVKSGLSPLLEAGAAAGADLVLYGHTHRQALERFSSDEIPALKKPLILLNPGALCERQFAIVEILPDGKLYINPTSF